MWWEIILSGLLLPSVVWLIVNTVSFFRAERGTAVRRKYRNAALVCLLLTVLSGQYLVRETVEWGIYTVFGEWLLIIGLIGIPLTAISVFVPALIRFLRTPKDTPERKKNKRSFIVSGVIAGILTAVFAAFMIMFAISIAHM